MPILISQRESGLWYSPKGILLLLAALTLPAICYLLGGSRHTHARPILSMSEPVRSTLYVNRAGWDRGTPSSQVPATAATAASPTISGSIYSVDGNAVANATVAATTFNLAGNLPTVASVVSSDSDGHFVLRLPEGTYQLNASKEGFGPASATAHSGETISLLLPQSGLIIGHVYDEQNVPVRRFTLDVLVAVPSELAAPPPLSSRTFDSSDGAFRVSGLPAWKVILRASAPGYAPAFSKSLKVRPREVWNMDLKLSRGCVLCGRVEDRAGTPAPYVLVDAEARIGPVAPTSGHAAPAANQTYSDDQGNFRLEHVPSGAILVRGYDGVNAVSTRTVAVSTCDQLMPLKLVMTAGGSVRGVARRELDGTPIPGARLSLISRALGFVNVRSDALGRFRFERIPAGSVRMELAYQNHSSVVYVKVQEGQETLQDVWLASPGRGELHGRVVAAGKPLSGVQVMVATFRGRERGLDIYYPLTDADGLYRLPALPDGSYLINVNSTPLSQERTLAGDVVTADLDVVQ